MQGFRGSSASPGVYWLLCQFTIDAIRLPKMGLIRDGAAEAVVPMRGFRLISFTTLRRSPLLSRNENANDATTCYVGS